MKRKQKKHTRFRVIRRLVLLALLCYALAALMPYFCKPCGRTPCRRFPTPRFPPPATAPRWC